MPTSASRTVTVMMPDGQIRNDVPADIQTQEELWAWHMATQTPATSIDKALAEHEADQLLAQAKAQTEYGKNQAEIAAFEAANPEARYFNPDIFGERPAIDPYLEHREKPLPPSPVQSFSATFKTKLLDDQDTMRRVLAKELFPDDPKGFSRVGFLDGEAVYVDDNGKLQQVSSGMTRFLAGMAADTPETVGGIGGTMLAGPWGGAAGASLAHGAKRAIAGQIYDEPFDPVGIGTGMAVEGALNALPDVAARGVNRLANRGTFVKMSKEQLRQAQEIQRRIKDTTGIDIDISQASANRRLIAMRNFLSRYPGDASDIMQTLDERAAEQFTQKADEVLDKIGSGVTEEAAGQGAVNAAADAIHTAKKSVQNKVSHLYRAAYDKNPVITDPELLKFLKLPHFPEAYKRGQRIAELEEAEAPTTMAFRVKETREKHPSGAFRVTKREIEEAPISQPDLRSLDYLKQGLDDTIADLESKAQGQITKESGALRRQRKQFIAALDRLPSGEYQKARAEYGRHFTNEVRPLLRGPVGVLARLQDKDAVTAAAKVFGSTSVSPSQLALAKRVIDAEDPTAWNDLVRTWLSGALNKARTETQHGVEVNPSGKLRKEVFGNPRVREKMHLILPAAAIDDFDNLMFAARRMSLTNVAGSNTMRDEEMKEILKGRALSTAKWFLTPRKKVIDSAERIAVEEGSEELARAITDPEKIKHIRRVLQMKPSKQQAILLSVIAASRTGVEAMRAAFPAEEDTPGFTPAK